MSKEKIEAATTKVAKALKQLVQAFEENGGALDETQFDKVFAYLQLLVHSAREQARAARVISIGAAESFSLDMDLPTGLSVPPIPLGPVKRERIVRDAQGPVSKPADLVADCDFIDDEDDLIIS